MSGVEEALAYWRGHEGLEGDEDDALEIDEMIDKGFEAGWKLAGGDQRLRAVELLQVMVGECCSEEAGKQFCESFGCKTLNDIRKALGDTDLE